MIQIDNCKLYNGDCLEMLPQLAQEGIKVDAIITDIPYGTTKCSWDSIIPFDKMWKSLAQIAKENTPILLFGTEPFSSALRLSNVKMYRYDWIWEKTRFSNFLCLHNQPAKNFENISVFYEHQPTYNPQMEKGQAYKASTRDKSLNNQQKLGVQSYKIEENTGTRFPGSVITFPNGDNSKVHPTQKPVSVMEYLVKTYTNEGDIVLDFTMGSGTTGVACANLKRKFIGIELNKEYFDIACTRIENETKQLRLF